MRHRLLAPQYSQTGLDPVGRSQPRLVSPAIAREVDLDQHLVGRRHGEHQPLGPVVGVLYREHVDAGRELERHVEAGDVFAGPQVFAVEVDRGLGLLDPQVDLPRLAARLRERVGVAGRRRLGRRWKGGRGRPGMGCRRGGGLLDDDDRYLLGLMETMPRK